MLTIRPVGLKDAKAYVGEHHRHNIPPVGGKFAIACYDDDRLCGVAICGRPVARRLDDGQTLEIYRNCTDGTRNARSKLYGACVRVAWAMGYERVITYTLQSETGASLRAAGFTNCGAAGGVSWDVPSRPREVEQYTLFGASRKYPDEPKFRWVKQRAVLTESAQIMEG